MDGPDVTGDEFPAEPLRPADGEDTGEPMPPEAAAAHEDFLRRSEEAHRELDKRLREPNMFDIVDLSRDESGERRIATLYLPAGAGPTARILLAVSTEYPASRCRYDDDGNWLVFERIGEDS